MMQLLSAGVRCMGCTVHAAEGPDAVGVPACPGPCRRARCGKAAYSCKAVQVQLTCALSDEVAAGCRISPGSLPDDPCCQSDACG